MKPRDVVRTRKLRLVRSVFASPGARRQTAGLLFALVVFAAGSAVLVGRLVPWVTDPVALRVQFEALGPYSPAVFVVVQAAQVVVAPIPGQALGFASGYLFGVVYGTVYSVLGATLGSYVVFRLSRRYGRRHVEEAIDAALVDQFDALVRRRGLLALFAVFLVPGLPDDVICFLAGLTDLRIRDMLVVSAAGRVPGYLVANAAGAQLEAGDLLGTLTLVGGFAVLSAVGYVYRDTLLELATR